MNLCKADKPLQPDLCSLQISVFLAVKVLSQTNNGTSASAGIAIVLVNVSFKLDSRNLKL